MSTRCFIGTRNNDGTIHAIYCHFDGYIECVGETLFKHYQDPDKIRKLINGGDISMLDERIDAPKGHSFESPVKGCTVFYGRDRGVEGTEAKIFVSTGNFVRAAMNSWAEFTYLYQCDEWTVLEDFKSLEESLEKCQV